MQIPPLPAASTLRDSLDHDGSPGDDHLTGSPGPDRLSGGTGNDALSGEHGNDHLRGETGDDRLQGGPGRDLLYGGSGNDALRGGEDADYLSGGDGSDLLDGGAGHDILDGGRGDDLLLGGPGRDTFRWQADELGGIDVLADFNPDEDCLAIDPDPQGMPWQMRLDHHPGGSQLQLASQQGEVVQTIRFAGLDLSQVGSLTDQAILTHLLEQADSPPYA